MYCKKHVNITVWRSCYIWLDSPDPTYANLALALILPWLICRFFCCNRKCPRIEFVRSWFQLQSWNLTTQEYSSYLEEFVLLFSSHWSIWFRYHIPDTMPLYLSKVSSKLHWMIGVYLTVLVPVILVIVLVIRELLEAAAEDLIEWVYFW